MGTELDAQQWRNAAARTLERVTVAERRFTVSLGASDITLLAAADELHAATKDANTWLVANPSPDERLRSHVVWSLNTLTEVALKAQRAVNDPSVDREIVVGRLRYLLTIFDFHSERLDTW
jgi:hypothetical protein